jgi:transcriptional regulator with XRE-family HTH domain
MNGSLSLSAQSCRDARLLLKISQQELAALAEISVSSVSRLERGERISDYAVGKLREALDKEGALFISPLDRNRMAGE